MPKDKEGKWITVHGKHIKVEAGESVKDAIARSLGKVNASKTVDKLKAKNSSGSDGKDIISNAIDKAKLRVKASNVSGGISIKEQVRTNKALIDKTESIGLTVDYESTLQERVRRVKDSLQNTNGIVTRADIGEVQVGKSISAKYVNTKAEKTVLTAVPEIIEKGVIIHTTKNHKGREYSTITIANKVYVDGHDGIMAVVLMQTGENKYKAHRVLTPNGEHMQLE